MSNLPRINIKFIIEKYYDKTPYTTINYTLSGLFDNDIGLVTLSSSIYGLYRSYNPNNSILIDISNIYLYGPSAYKYSVSNYLTTTGIIYQRYIYAFINNKVYDKTTDIYLTLSNTISGDIILVTGSYPSSNAGNYSVSLSLPVNLLLIDTFSLANYTAPWGTSVTGGNTGFYISADNTKMVICNYNTSRIYYSTYNTSTGTWSSIANTLDTGVGNYQGISLRNDGLVGAAVSTSAGCYIFTWNGTNYSELTRTLDTTDVSYKGMAMSQDGSKLIVSDGQYVYWAEWNGTNFGTFTQILDNNARNYEGQMAISADNNVIVYNAFGGYLYWSTWNGTNYSIGTQSLDTTIRYSRAIALSNDKSLLFASFTNDSTSSVHTARWNAALNNYTAFSAISTSSIPGGLDSYGLCLAPDQQTFYLAPYDSNTIFSVAITYTYLAGVNNNSNNYYILNSYTISGSINPRYLYASINDKVYDKTTDIYLTLSNTLSGDIVSVTGSYPSSNAGSYSVSLSLPVSLPLINTFSFANYTTPWGTSITNGNEGFYISADNTKMVICNYNTSRIYYSTYNTSTGTWSSIANTLDTGIGNYAGIVLRNDGLVGATVLLNTGYYIFTWNGTNYSELTKTLDTTDRAYQGIGMSQDGSRLIVTVYGEYVYWAEWNGTNFGTFTQTLDNNARNYSEGQIAVSADNSLIAYGVNGGYLYWSTWNGTNYSISTQTLDTTAREYRGIALSNDKSLLFASFTNDNTSSVYTARWNKSLNNYTAFSAISTSSIPSGLDSYGLCLAPDQQTFYLAPWGSTTIYSVAITYTYLAGVNNYQLSSNIIYGNILQKKLIASFTGLSKIYDGSLIAPISYTLSGKINGDLVDLSNNYQSYFINRFVGSSKLININNLTLTGSNYINYYIDSSGYTFGNILQKKLIASFTGLSKIYDESLIAPISYTLSGIISGDLVDLSNNYQIYFIDRFVGSSKLININNLSLTGSDYINYYIDSSGYTFGNITSKLITSNFFGIDKTYNKTVVATSNYTISGLFNSDIGYIDISNIYISMFRDYNVNNDIIIDVSNIKLYGALAYNYYINSTNTTSANIIKKNVTLNPVGISKAYDQTTSATFNYTISGIIVTDLVDISSNLYYANFVTNQANNNLLVTISGISLYYADSNNYNILTYAYTSADIYKKILTATSINKIYNKTLLANITLSGVLGNDIIVYWAEYDTINAGLNKTVYIALSGSIFLTSEINNQSNLIYYYPFNGDILNYASGIGVSNLTNNGTTFNTSIKKLSNSSLSFNSNSYLIIPVTILNNLPAATLSVWVYFNTLNNYIITSKQWNGNNTFGVLSIGCYASSGGVFTVGTSGKVYWHSKNDIAFAASNIILTTNTWYLITITFNTTECLIYINGLLDSTTNADFSIPNAPNVTNSLIGYWQGSAGGGGGILIDGYITEFRIYNIVLSSTEIETLYNYNNNNNYELYSTITYGDINPSLLFPIFSVIPKQYDKTFTSYLEYTLNGLYSNDIVNISNYYANYSSIYPGTNINITISGLTLSGPNSNNYYILNSYTTSGTINQRYVYASLNDKVYDTTTNIYLTLSNTLSGDIVSVTGSYPSSNAGSYSVNLTLSSTFNVPLIDTFSLANYTTPWGTSVPSGNTGFSISADNTKMVICNHANRRIYYSTYNTGTWSSIANTLDTGVGEYLGIVLRNDGLMGATVVDSNGYYIFTWNGTNYSTLTRTLDSTNRTYQGIGMSQDGTKLIVSVNGGYIYWAEWNGTNFGTFTQILDNNSRNYQGKIGVSADNSLIVYGVGDSGGYLYWSTWDGTNYSIGTQTLDTTIRKYRGVALSNDKSLLFASVTNDYTSSVYTARWNAALNNYTALTAISTNSIPGGLDAYGFCLAPNQQTLYLAPYGSTTIYSVAITYTYTYLAEVNNNEYYMLYQSSISGRINPRLLVPTFYVIPKQYDGNQFALVSYNLSGFFPVDIGYVDISNVWQATYRSNQAALDIPIDISNIKLYGSNAYNYFILPTSTISGTISKRYLYTTGIDKIYDQQLVANVTISNVVSFDIVQYVAQFADINVGPSKLINVALSDQLSLLATSFFLAVPNLQLWLDAKDLSTLVLSGNSLLQWNDKSGYGRNATKHGLDPGNATYNPTGFNNLPGIQINSGQGLSSPMPSGTIVTGITIFVVFQKNGAANSYETLISRTAGFMPGPIDMFNTTRLQGNGTSYNDAHSGFNIQTATGLNIMSFTVTSGLWDEYVNGSSIFSQNFSTLFVDHASSNGLYIGTRADPTTKFTGIVSEVIVYNRVLTQNERQSIEGYLAYKWSLQSSLPINHPFKNYIPANSNNNYQLATNITSANIFQRSLTATFTGINRAYNSLTDVQTSYTISGIYPGDIVDISNIYTSNFVDINTGLSKLIYINNVNLYGNHYYNYAISISGSTSANIVPAQLYPYFYSLGKVYDRNQYALVSYNLSGFFPVDIGYVDISNVWQATYRSNQAALDIPIDISNIKLYGSNAYNYFILTTSTISGTISKRYLYTTGIDKIYDKTTTASITISGTVSGDIISYVANFNNYVAEPNKVINVTLPLFNNNLWNGWISGSTNFNSYAGGFQYGTACSSTGQYVYVVGSQNDNLICVSSDYGRTSTTFIVHNTNLSRSVACSPTGQYVVVSTNAGIYCNNTFGSGAWTFQSSGPSWASYITWSREGSRLFLAGVNGSNIYLSIDNGNNWTEMANTSVNSIGCCNYAGTIIYGYVNKIIYKFYNIASVSSFLSTTITPSNTSNIVKIACDSTGTYILFTCRLNATPFISQDGGTTWFTGIVADWPALDGSPIVSDTGSFMAVFNYGTTSYYNNNYGNANSWIAYTNIAESYTVLAICASVTCQYIYIGLYGQNGKLINSNYGLDSTIIIHNNNNYQLSSDIIYGNILQKKLTASFTNLSKIYDGLITIPISYTLSGKINGDLVDLSNNYQSYFIDRFVGSSKLISINNVILTGSDYINYYIDSSGYTFGSILQKKLTASFTNLSKIYDGLALIPLNYTLSGIINDEIVDLSNNYQSYFIDKSAGSSKLITINNVNLIGSDYTNYYIDSSGYTFGSINKKLIQSIFTTSTKNYNALNDATVNGTLSGVLLNDISNVIVNYGSAIFSSIDASSNILVNISNINLSGSESNNYDISSTNISRGNILSIGVTATYISSDKVYDGTVNATVTGSLSGILIQDISNVVLILGTTLFTNKNSGLNKLINISSVILTGPKSVNYNLSSSGIIYASITRKPITATYQGNNKVYNGLTTATVTGNPIDIADSDIVWTNWVSSTSTITPNNYDDWAGTHNIACSSNGRYVYYITGLGYIPSTNTNIYCSADYGNTFVAYDFGIYGDPIRVLCHPSGQYLVISAAGGSIYTNNNFGSGPWIYSATESWIVTNETNNQICWSRDGSRLFTIWRNATNNIYFIYLSTNNGNTWVETTMIPGNNIQVGSTGNAMTCNYDGTVLYVGLRRFSGSDPSITKFYNIVSATSFSKINYDGNNNILYEIWTNGDGSIVVGGFGLVNTYKTISRDGGATWYDYLFVPPYYNNQHKAEGPMIISDDGSFMAQIRFNYGGFLDSTYNDNYGHPDSWKWYGTVSSSMSQTGARLNQLWATGSSTGKFIYFVYGGKIWRNSNFGFDAVADPLGIQINTANFISFDASQNSPIIFSDAILTGGPATNYDLLTTSGITYANITKKMLTSTFITLAKIYDKTTAAIVVGSLIGVINKDISNVYIIYGTANFSNKIVNTNILVDISGITIIGSNNYDIISTNTSYGTITKKNIYANYTSYEKIYDSLLIAPISYTLSGIINGDLVDLSNNYQSNFINRFVGSSKLININNVNLIGADYINYYIDSSGYTFGSIIPKLITSNFFGVNKYYDKTLVATSNYTISGLFNSDISYIDISNIYISMFRDYNVNNNIIVDISNIKLYGTLAYNYYINSTNITSANIIKKYLTGIGINKIYDKTIIASISLSGLIGNDQVGYNAIYNSSIASFNKIITATLKSGPEVDYYTDPFPTLSSDIYYTGIAISQDNLKMIISAGGHRLQFSLYDISSNSWSIPQNTLESSTISSDGAVHLVGNGDRGVINTNGFFYIFNWTGSNYSALIPVLDTTVINFKCSAMSLDGTRIFGTAQAGGIYYADWNGTNYGTFIQTLQTNPNPNNTNVYNYSIACTNDGLRLIYEYNESDPSTINIMYISDWNSTLNNYDNGRIIYSNIPLVYTCMKFSNDNQYLYAAGIFSELTLFTYDPILDSYINRRQIGSGAITGGFRTLSLHLTSDEKTVYITSKSISKGNFINNYQLSDNIIYGNILQKKVTASFISIPKIYDSLVIAPISYTLSGIINGDLVDLSNNYQSNFINKIAALSKLININNIVLTGSDYINYYIDSSGYTFGNILQKKLTASFAGLTKIYDSLLIAPISYTLSGIINGDLVDISNNYQSYFIDRFVESSKLININNLNLTGSDYINYYIDSSGYTFGSIVPKLITSNFYSLDKIYDKTSVAYLRYTLSGIYAIDSNQVDISNIWISNANYKNINAGNNIMIDISNIQLYGDLAYNYLIESTTITYGNIFQKLLNTHGINKINDNTNIAELYIDGQYENDIVELFTYDASYNNLTIGRNLISYSNLSISGFASHNYYCPSSGYTTGIILSNAKIHNIKSINESYYQHRIWSMESYQGPCYLSFTLDPLIYVGLSEKNNNTNDNYIGYFIYLDQSNNIFIIEPNNTNTLIRTTSFGLNINSTFLIYYDGYNISYYKDSILLKNSIRRSRVNLYMNILFGYINQRVRNIIFISIKEFYLGGNNIICDGLKDNDTVTDLSGIVIYSGTSQGATEDGRYTIIPAGLTSRNYNIKYINGFLNIRKSLQR